MSTRFILFVLFLIAGLTGFYFSADLEQAIRADESGQFPTHAQASLIHGIFRVIYLELLILSPLILFRNPEGGSDTISIYNKGRFANAMDAIQDEFLEFWQSIRQKTDGKSTALSRSIAISAIVSISIQIVVSMGDIQNIKLEQPEDIDAYVTKAIKLQYNENFSNSIDDYTSAIVEPRLNYLMNSLKTIQEKQNSQLAEVEQIQHASTKSDDYFSKIEKANKRYEAELNKLAKSLESLKKNKVVIARYDEKMLRMESMFNEVLQESHNNREKISQLAMAMNSENAAFDVLQNSTQALSDTRNSVNVLARSRCAEVNSLPKLFRRFVSADLVEACKQMDDATDKEAIATKVVNGMPVE
ncbi:MAG: hypothetical protein OEZ58_15615 [Gammaproteobacteria bacterium]|nr:hypothetical protein [Gammaproteobacteria bacterium]MDH5730423.1 hypothetical protein [Gammaproteobacteria bacterium]